MPIDWDKMSREMDEYRKPNERPVIEVTSAKIPISEREITEWHYIGRQMRGSVLYTGSALANPYRRGSGEPQGATIERYKRWLWEQMQERSTVYQELLQIMGYSLEGDGIALVCWCKHLGPDTPCHGDVVKAAVEWLWEQGVRP